MEIWVTVDHDRGELRVEMLEGPTERDGRPWTSVGARALERLGFEILTEVVPVGGEVEGARLAVRRPPGGLVVRLREQVSARVAELTDSGAVRCGEVWRIS